MTVLLRLLGSAWALLVGAVADFFEWLAKPSAKLKLACAVLAFMTAVAAMRARDAEQAAQLAAAQCALDKHLLQDTIGARDASLAEVKANAAAERRRKNEQILRAEAMAKEAERRARAAEASLKAFEDEYEHRPQACKQALEYLKTACPTLGDY